MIWTREEPTEYDIYHDLDADIKLTADDLHQLLDGRPASLDLRVGAVLAHQLGLVVDRVQE